MKKVLLTTLLITLSASTAYAADQVSAQVREHYKTVYENVDVVSRRCEMVDVPVYGTRRVERNGGAAGNALLGMILGGVVGKGLTGKDKGAAAGAIMGGVIGADQGGKTDNQSYVTGYRKEKSCYDEVDTQQRSKSVYSHSTVEFRSNGQRRKLKFYR